MTAYKIIVTGIVQGVGFRYYTKQKADDLKLFGTVENLSDGRVLIFVQGNVEQVNNFIAWCHDGPANAKVEKMEYQAMEIKDIGSFEIKR